MKKPKLSKQQLSRIEHKQHQQRQGQNSQTALVTARFSRHVEIQPDSAPDKRLRCHVRAHIGSLAVGDKVAFMEDKKEAVITAVFPRSSVIERPDGLGKLKPVAANIDQVFIVIAPQPEPHTVLLDRYLLAAENAGIEAHIILNKIDSPELLEALTPLLAIYQALNYRVLVCSSWNKIGLSDLQAQLSGKLSVLVGQSGVGKSSIINVLSPEQNTPTGALSEGVDKGRHTTTTAQLYRLPDSGYIIDSPGIREFHLDHLERQQVFSGFRELHGLANQCQFRNCQHDQEPDCAVQRFIEQQQMHPSRLQSLGYILNNQ